MTIIHYHLFIYIFPIIFTSNHSELYWSFHSIIKNDVLNTCMLTLNQKSILSLYIIDRVDVYMLSIMIYLLLLLNFMLITFTFVL